MEFSQQQQFAARPHMPTNTMDSNNSIHPPFFLKRNHSDFLRFGDLTSAGIKSFLSNLAPDATLCSRVDIKPCLNKENFLFHSGTSFSANFFHQSLTELESLILAPLMRVGSSLGYFSHVSYYTEELMELDKQLVEDTRDDEDSTYHSYAPLFPTLYDAASTDIALGTGAHKKKNITKFNRQNLLRFRQLIKFFIYAMVQCSEPRIREVVMTTLPGLIMSDSKLSKPSIVLSLQELLL